MSFDALLDDAIALLRKRGRLTHRSLRRQFALDDATLEDLIFELVEGQQVASDEGGSVLVWVGDGAVTRDSSGPPGEASPGSYTPKHLADALKPATATEGEIKQVTVLFCDIVDATELSQSVGAEEMHAMLNAFFELSLEVVHSYGGTINQFLGDGFMALFGAPVAFEDHARRAVRATAELRARLDERWEAAPSKYGRPIHARFGVNSGKVVVGGIGDDLRMDYTAVGDTSNFASRLQAMAGPGEVLISESTAFMVRGDADLEALPPREVKGAAEPMAAYRLLGIRRPQASAIDLRGGRVLSPFVGREQELQRMVDIAARMEDGRGHVIALRADPGVGKSRLVYEFRERLKAAGTAFFEGRCVSFEHTTPYRPLTDLVREVAGISDADPPGVTARKVRAYLESRGLPGDDWARYLLRLYGVSSGLSELDRMSPEAIQARTNTMFRKLAQGASRIRPIVLFIEDLHWIDSASEACLDAMIDIVRDHPVVFVFTYRPRYDAGWLDRSNVTHMELQRLPAEHGKSLVYGVVGQSVLSDETLETILERAEGVPFYMEELTRAVLESGDGQSSSAVPGSIEGVIASRIDRLPDVTKRMLHTAAVLGRRFTAGLLREVWDESERIDPILAELRDLAFIKKQEGALEPTYVFAHALTQDVAYGSMLSGRRRSIHAAAGAALERLYDGRLDEVMDRLAHHYSNAEDARKAIDYLRAFAQDAAAGYSHFEAARALEAAIEHVETLDESERASTTLSIADGLCNSLYFLGKFQETTELLDRCEPLLEQVGDDEAAGVFHFWTGHTCTYTGRMGDAFEHAEKAIDHARAAGDALTEGRAAYVMERASFWTGKYRDALQYGDQAIAALVRAGDRWWEAQSLWMIGWSHGAMGAFDAALEAEERTAEVGEEIQDPRLPCYAAWTAAVMHAMQGDTDEGIAKGLQSIDRSPDLLNTGVAWGFTGFAYLEAGDVEEALPLLEQGSQRLQEMNFRALQCWFTVWWGEAELLRGDLDRAEQLVLEGRDVASQVGNLWGLGLAHRSLGRIALARGDLAAASEHLGNASETFEPLHAEYWGARVEMARAEVAHATGDDEAAGARLGSARAAFDKLACPAWVERVDTFARERGISLDG